jgi:Fe-S cluster assembly protein SufD
MSTAPWLTTAREHAASAFSAKNLPTSHEEPWKYAANKLKKLPEAGTGTANDASVFNEALAPYFAPSDNPLINANTAFAQSGNYIAVKAGTTRPLEILRYQSAGQVKHVIHLEENAKASLVLIHEGEGAYWHNQVIDITLARGASLALYHLQREASQAYHTGHIRVTVGEQACYRDFYLSRGAALARHTVEVNLAGEGATTHLNGAYILGDGQYADIYLPVIHQVARTYSHQHYKGVLSGKSEATFFGKVMVPRDSQKIEAYQLNNNLLLSDDAQVNTRPALEIYADDVKCSHGATVGELDEEALYYLKSRGLSDEDARKILIDAFIAEMIENIEEKEVREILL